MPRNVKSRRAPRAPRRKRTYTRRAPRKLAIKRNPFPLSTICQMKYVDQISIDAVGGLTASYFFRANSIYDPNYTGAGHQPYGHDQYMALYDQYEVIKSSIRVTAVGGTIGNAAGHGILGVAVKDDYVAESNYLTIMEAKGSHYKVMNVDGKVTVSHGFNSKKMFPKAALEATAAQFGNNPTEEAYFQVWTGGVYPLQEPGNLYCTVTIIYTVRCWELKDLGQS